MADHSKKSKPQTKAKALLGELESIKSLLEESTDEIIDFDADARVEDDAIDPPILTTTVEPEADDVPVLTDAFDAVVDDMEASQHEESQADITAFDDPEFEQWPDEKTESDVVSAAGDDGGMEAEAPASSLFDDLEAEFERQFDQTDTAPEKNSVGEAATQAEPTTAEIAPAQTAATPEKKTTPRENQPSLFDDSQASPPAKAKAKPEPADIRQNRAAAKPATDSGKTTSGVSQPLSKPLKTENPFLPKHIRDRLHTSRSLQDEITSISSTAAGVKSTEAKTENKTTATPANKEEQLIDELVSFYLPKIESQLRRRLRESLDAKDDEHDHT